MWRKSCFIGLLFAAVSVGLSALSPAQGANWLEKNFYLSRAAL